jgi:hypothetical protein
LKQRGYSAKFLMMCECPSDFPREREKFMELWLTS